MKKTPKKTRPTYAEVTEQLANLRRKVRLLRAKMSGEVCARELSIACGVKGVYNPKERRAQAGALSWFTVELDYILMNEAKP